VDPRVQTAQGWIEGLDRGRYQSFRGVPYARPPVGPLRLRPPEPMEPWAGVRSAAAYGPALPQEPSSVAGLDPGPLDEGALLLNVDTPRADDSRRPVLVWIHGGSFSSGSNSLPLYDGGRLAVRRDVVVVTIQY
jgi:para-nitrobenzyl esterase